MDLHQWVEDLAAHEAGTGKIDGPHFFAGLRELVNRVDPLPEVEDAPEADAPVEESVDATDPADEPKTETTEETI